MARITHRNDRMHRGLVPTAQLGTGSATATTVLLGNQTWGSAPGTSFGSNANSVGSANAPGASSSNARADHVHQGVHQLTANGSNALVGDVNVAAGSGIGITQSGQTVTITNTGTSSGGGSGTLTTIEEADGSPTDSAVTKLVFPNGSVGIASHVATITFPAGSGGDLTRIAETVLGAAAADITITGISGAYRDLIVVVRGRSTNGGAGIGLDMQVGSGSIDTGSNYAYIQNFTGWTGGANSSNSGTNARIGAIPNSGAAAGAFGYCRIEIMNYADTAKRKGWIGQSYSIDGSGSLRCEVGGTWLNASAALDQIKILASAGNLDTGSAVTIYGRG